MWIAAHALLYHKDRLQVGPVLSDRDEDEERERQERCRMAALAAIFAEREVRSGMPVAESVMDSE